MFRSSPILGFAARFLLGYGVLMVLWPVVRGGYRELFRTGGDSFFGALCSVRFEGLPKSEDTDDTKIFVKSRESSKWTWMTVSSRHVGFMSTAAVVGLIVATPIPWSRRARALLWGLALVHGFIALRLGVLIAYVMSLAGRETLPATLWNLSVDRGVLSIATGQAFSYIGPVVIWLLVSLRREDLDMIMSASRDDPVK